MRMSKETQAKMKEIQDIEDKYGLTIFRMGLTHMVDIGFRNMDENSVEEGIKTILAQREADKATGGTPFMSPEFQCDILRCAFDLTKFSIWQLFAYIKKHVVVDV